MLDSIRVAGLRRLGLRVYGVAAGLDFRGLRAVYWAPRLLAVVVVPPEAGQLSPRPVDPEVGRRRNGVRRARITYKSALGRGKSGMR